MAGRMIDRSGMLNPEGLRRPRLLGTDMVNYDTSADTIARPMGDEFPGSGYTDEEQEVLKAADRYRHDHGLRFLAVTDMLLLLKQLGYTRR